MALKKHQRLKVFTIHSVENNTFCFPSNSCQDISLQNHKCEPQGDWRKKKRFAEVIRIHQLGTINGGTVYPVILRYFSLDQRGAATKQD